jgi:hypothetical protein
MNLEDINRNMSDKQRHKYCAISLNVESTDADAEIETRKMDTGG